MKQLRYSAETEAAMQETRDIINGNIPTKSYSTARELFSELDTFRPVREVNQGDT